MCFSAVEGNSTNTYSVFRVPCYWITLDLKQSQTLTTHNANRHCRVRFLYTFVGQPLLKQLYSLFKLEISSKVSCSADTVRPPAVLNKGRWHKIIWISLFATGEPVNRVPVTPSWLFGSHLLVLIYFRTMSRKELLIKGIKLHVTPPPTRYSSPQLEVLKLLSILI